MQNITINDEFERALDLLENTSENIVLTGKAGTGKSTLLDYFRHHSKKNIAVIAPTGVAAINVGGQTIHSFFGFSIDVTVEKIQKQRKSRDSMYRELDMIIIDEISMVRADLLDCVDTFLRLDGKDPLQPFGGIQMVFVGDIFQLPPIVRRDEEYLFASRYPSPFFFDSLSFSSLSVTIIELTSIHRQHDEKFIAILNALRTNSLSEEDFASLNARFLPNTIPEDLFITLTTTNEIAAKQNAQNLQALSSPSKHYSSETLGDVDTKSLPTDTTLTLKKGAHVMLLNNDPMGRWVNGTIGVISSLGENSVKVMTEDSREVIVEPFTWHMYRFHLNEMNGHVESKEVGSFTQLPIKLAWAITIHKSQGKTFDHVVLDIGRGTFAHGHLYVALSRCRSLSGIILRQRILPHHIQLHARVVEFAQIAHSG